MVVTGSVVSVVMGAVVVGEVTAGEVGTDAVYVEKGEREKRSVSLRAVRK